MPTLFDELPRPNVEVTSGVVHLPNFLDLGAQEKLVSQSREIARSLAKTPLAMAKPQLRSGQMSVHMLTIGRHWVTDQFRYVQELGGTRVPPVPAEFVELAHRTLNKAGELSDSLKAWSRTFRPEMVLVNYYEPTASMNLHQDGYEISEAPVISISIGDTALFRLGGTENRNKPWHDIPLLSGDVIIFGGANRRAFHGVPKIIADTAPLGCGLKQGRINITIRQVDL
ncbi:alpha-ketoglutarate-dependent dioxygenase AlkB [Corynebacterium callunae]|uniref:alpha-ketoglutarate-dependent dioxygenase AlkB family protein n=1 Tax=Corynebacterium callunae TaxID=1721 RepID=UPI003981A596